MLSVRSGARASMQNDETILNVSLNNETHACFKSGNPIRL
jgi:hypothetical protein